MCSKLICPVKTDASSLLDDERSICVFFPEYPLLQNRSASWVAGFDWEYDKSIIQATWGEYFDRLLLCASGLSGSCMLNIHLYNLYIVYIFIQGEPSCTFVPDTNNARLFIGITASSLYAIIRWNGWQRKPICWQLANIIRKILIRDSVSGGIFTLSFSKREICKIFIFWFRSEHKKMK